MVHIEIWLLQHVFIFTRKPSENTFNPGNDVNMKNGIEDETERAFNVPVFQWYYYSTNFETQIS